MEQIHLTISTGKTEKVNIYSIDDFPYPTYDTYKTVMKRFQRKGASKIFYYNIPAAFDIETTSIKAERPYGFMYVWMFCLDDSVVFGRTWEEFLTFIKRLERAMHLDGRHRLAVYVHFLSFEFMFIKNFFEFEEVFSKDKRKVMKARAGAIEFRCSYFLSNMSLNKFCENYGALFYKRDGDEFNYSIKRFPHTNLSQKEKAYCYCDVRGLCECIQTMLNDGEDIASIPITSTGFVRREFKKVMITTKNQKVFHDSALDEHLYQFCKDAGRGADTHANRDYIGQTLHGIHSFDIESSYPYVELFKYFPMGAFKKIDTTGFSEVETLEYCKEYCCLIDISIFNIETKSPSPYIDIAHLKEYSNITQDNGRVLKADYVRYRITELDFYTILEDYDIESIKVNELWIAKRGMLPIEYRLKVLQFAQDKTLLKGITKKEYEYMKSKNKLNSTFGFTITDICRDEYVYSNADMDFGDAVKCDVASTLEKYYSKKGNFLVYQWGVWILGHSRRRLRKVIQTAASDYVYGDTDSAKVKESGYERVAAYCEKVNKEVIAEWKEMRSQHPEYHLLDSKGKEHFLGIWEYEGKYDDFKTFGAKKYCVKKDGKIEITVAGLSKEKGGKEVERLGGVEKGFTLDMEFKNSGRTTAWYNTEKTHKIMLDGHEYTQGSNVAVLNTTYTLNLGTKFEKFLTEYFAEKGIDITILLDYNE